MNRLSLEHVQYLPKELTPGVLFVSKEYSVAGHLCACGCGQKVITPLGPAEWTFSERNGRPTLYPSIGNWQLPCRSHYFIKDGAIDWSYSMSEKSIAAGRRAEEAHRQQYYDSLTSEKGFWSRLWAAIVDFFR